MHWRELISSRELLLILIQRNLKIRYQGSALGFLWTLLNPLFMVLVYWLFIRLVRFPINLGSLLIGVMAWQFFVMCAGDSVSAVSGQESLVKKVYLPRLLLPLSTVLANCVNFILSLIVVAVFLLLQGVAVDASLLWLLPVIGVHLLFCTGMALFLSCANVYFRDTEHIIGVLLMAWFFMTPIIYEWTRVPEGLLLPFLSNPMAFIIVSYKHVLLNETLPPAGVMAAGLVSTAVVFLVGLLTFLRGEAHFANEL